MPIPSIFHLFDWSTSAIDAVRAPSRFAALKMEGRSDMIDVGMMAEVLSYLSDLKIESQSRMIDMDMEATNA